MPTVFGSYDSEANSSKGLYLAGMPRDIEALIPYEGNVL